MSKWISDAYIKMLMQTDRLLQGNCEYKLWEQEVEKIVDVMPSIDIVRCKECKFSESVITSWSTDGKNNVVERLCKVHKWSVKDDDFCSYGQKGDENVETD